jgi:hypothetical protein
VQPGRTRTPIRAEVRDHRVRFSRFAQLRGRLGPSVSFPVKGPATSRRDTALSRWQTGVPCAITRPVRTSRGDERHRRPISRCCRGALSRASSSRCSTRSCGTVERFGRREPATSQPGDRPEGIGRHFQRRHQPDRQPTASLRGHPRPAPRAGPCACLPLAVTAGRPVRTPALPRRGELGARTSRGPYLAGPSAATGTSRRPGWR